MRILHQNKDLLKGNRNLRFNNNLMPLCGLQIKNQYFWFLNQEVVTSHIIWLTFIVFILITNVQIIKFTRLIKNYPVQCLQLL